MLTIKSVHLSLMDMVDSESDYYKCIGIVVRVIYFQNEDKFYVRGLCSRYRDCFSGW